MWDNTLMNGQAFIWDLDGTLLDSYKVIVESLYLAYKEKGFEVDRKEILSKVIWGTVTTFTNYMEEKHGLKFEEIKEKYEILIVSRLERLNK